MIAVTGANGYVGGRILAHLRASGVEAIALVRRPEPGDERARRYALAEPLAESALDGVHTVVHAAYDVAARGRAVRDVNVTGSAPLLDSLAERGGRALLISSLSAFQGARSLYGRAKLELEQAVQQRGGIVLRPGLVFGIGAGGMFGALITAVSGRAPVPMIGGSQRLFVTHDEHLATLVAALVSDRAAPERPLLAAHQAPTTLRAIAEQIARAEGQRLRTIPVSGTLAHLGLRAAEAAGLRLPFRSDSLLGLLNPIPLDQVAALAPSPVEFPALAPRLWRG